MLDTTPLSAELKDEPLGEYKRQVRPDGDRRHAAAREKERVRERRTPGGQEETAFKERLAQLAHDWLWPAGLGALAGAARLPGGAFPLASAYVVALLTAGDRRRAAAAGAAVLASMALGVGGLRWVEQALIVLQAGFLAALLPEGNPALGQDGQGREAGFSLSARRRSRRSPGAGAEAPGARGRGVALRHLPYLVLAGTVLLRVGMLYVAGAGVEAMAWATGESLLELGAALALLPAVQLHRRRPVRLEPAQLAGLVLALAGLAWVLGPLSAGWVHPGETLVFAGILLLSWGGGVGLAAPAGAGLGLLTAAAGGGVETVGLCALAGLGAGLGRAWGKGGAVGGLMASQLAVTFLGLRALDLYPHLVQAAVASFALLLAPRTLLQRWLDWVGVGDGGKGPGSHPGSRGGEAPAVPDGTAARLRRFAAIFDELARAFGPPGEGGPEGGEGTPSGEVSAHVFVDGVVERLCARCSAYRFCWEEHVAATYRDVGALMATMQKEGNLSLSQFPEGLRRRCIQQRQLLRVAAETFQLIKLHLAWQRRFAQSQELVPQQLRGLACLVRDMAAQAALEGARAARNGGGDGAGAHGETVSFHLETAAARRVKEGEEVSGDSDDRISLGPHRVALVLSDGMGSGRTAARESQAVVRVLRCLLEAGFDEHFAIKMVNSVLLLRSPEETFATIDLAVFDGQSGWAKFFKVGAAPSFIVRRGGDEPPRVEVVRGSSAPAGILQQVEVEPERRRLHAGDTLVMVTDGLLESLSDPADAEEQLVRWLQEAGEGEPGALARGLLDRLVPGAAGDDVTVVVARVGAVDHSEPPEVGVYRRLRPS